MNQQQHGSARSRQTAIIGWLLVAGWAAMAAGITVWNPAWLRSLELQTQSWFFRLRGQVAPPKQIVILAIDDDSLTRGRDSQDIQALEPIQSWPWRRTAYAEAIEKVMAAGAKAVALDVVLDVPSKFPQDDRRLQQTLERYSGRVTLAAQHTISRTPTGSLEQLIYPIPQFQTTPNSIGLINYLIEPDGQFRRLAEVYLKQIEPNLQESQARLQTFDTASLQAAGLVAPPPRGDYINFYGGQDTFLTLPFWYVLYPQNWQVLQQQQVFKDKLVLIGPTASVLQDLHPTPFGKVPGTEIHANAIATLLENRAIAAALPDPSSRSLVVLLGVLLVGSCLHWLRYPLRQFLAALGLGLLWLGIGYGSFISGGFILPIVVPVGAIGLLGLSLLANGSVSDQLEKLRLRRTLERYVSAPIVQEILNQPEDFRSLLQGRKLNAAVLFCDIRGFTTLSFQLPAEPLVAQLNTYLDAMVGAIVAAGGTVDKFIGDAVMAEFGSPVSRGEREDALNAIQAALGMRQALAELRRSWQQQGKPLLFNGMGISFGEVIAGNIGSLKRLEYTVIGDTVNVASRVEGLTKDLGTDILITESLYTLVQDKVEVVFMGEQPLRGRGSRIKLYSLVGWQGDDPALYHEIQAGQARAKQEIQRYLENHGDR
ncbi:MAG TPA: adenylate/guanylate cyclase domain-containing protein [Microcoleaceae cyanobacterium]|jgi:adenylate cyclase